MEWKDIPGYNGRYQCTKEGLVRSVDWKNSRGFLRKGKTMSQTFEGNGYFQVNLVTCNGPKRISVHRLIAISFINTIDGKDFVNHKNGIKSDNRVENLEWCTKSENSKHSFVFGLQCNKGENHPSNKLSETQVLRIREEYSKGGTTSRKLAEKYSMSKTQILDIIRKKSWSHLC